MKTIALTLLSALVFALPAFAGEKHDHKHEAKAGGPNGGRVITKVEPHLEFLITKERKVEVTALTDDFKAAAWSGQVVAVTAGDRKSPTKLEFQEQGGKLVSTNALPEGKSFPIVVSIKANTEGKAVHEKFNLNLAECPTCKHQEYACICEHGHEH